MSATTLSPQPDSQDRTPVVDVSDSPTSTPILRTMDLARRHGPAFVQRLHGQDTLFVSSLDLVTEL
ncbi:hypothetical protein GTY41_28155, partial [Streptomyces sp. SID685]